MSPPADTLSRLWATLGLDSLPADAGTAESLAETRVPDWEQATLRQDLASSPPVTERVDLPRITLSPPDLDGPGGHEPHQELVVTGLLGEGGMGRVLLARQESLGREVAVKVPRPGATRGTINALLAESKVTGGLEHPGVIPVYSLASDAKGQPALVMKRVDGVSWSMLIRHAEDPAWSRIGNPGADRLETHVELLRSVCNTIAFAHRKGVLHRDIKPANVLIGEFGEVYVADWGIATTKVRHGEQRKPRLVGTPVYMAPEMVTGDDAQMDERTDVFLLGATLYELLSGEPPWSGADLKQVLEVALGGRPRPLPPGAPQELVEICAKAMAASPADRYASVLELREALGGFLRHRGSVQLARAAEGRLEALMASLQGSAHDEVYPLLSECRFGFSQALREWPENAAARRGLSRCIEATAHFELARGNLAAARALIDELEDVPALLREALLQLEKQRAAAARQQQRLEHLSQELDPRVASRQRVWMVVVSIIAISAAVLLPLLFPELRAELRRLGNWYMSSLMAGVLGMYALAVWYWRGALLSTRLNRRVTSLVGVAMLGTLGQRVVGAIMGLEVREVVMQNHVLVAAVCIAGGATLHSGFFWSAAAFLTGLLLSWLSPGYEPQLFGLAAVVALIVAATSWRGWRSELALKPRGDDDEA